MELKWTRSKALSDIARLYEFLAAVNQPAAARALQQLTAAPNTLLASPGIGERLEGFDRVPGSGVTEPAEGALRAKEDGHRGSWRRPNTHQGNHDDQAHYRNDRVG
ncbi:type II toxin-antitoxin system RelE/ParE family toxin [Pseudomonas sp. OVF7]|nr:MULTISPECIES: type II toxin-antitoxin system RelE/ParE family toxin [unclassified Pseudomonas]UHH01023.1 type II toxin-antitoxin system RelE/ParE family toxin [Pseudomonas sp. 7-41]WLD69464.1 type II toxin-antitoxin system RelE/ParE family toxin [Pseudomonas sp. OVF7]